ncbi:MULTISPECIES: alpha/beta hydrolase [Bacillus]|uniref:alpha/beta hydrolase n=1 Tax=Bacillus TaxID=1386 RepID=UPI00202A992A|nr:MULTISPECIES: alpha/beta fold hydrolase [Bacillus subtilis group]MCY8203415.1 alpha/beta fold hydrolase [Bacillus sp. N12A5]MCY8106926.1 alpha/beta fold hydrolase [Bacillus mojavensis]MCY8980936.1 alpha/beta fold hydrolase [Bacillus halotolerans]MEC1423316.1 alpha/beta fold hydrolase [Bacillus subtilis]MEC1580092.1 alpha/beta fold hydrolase [Bacillus subtilis]
MEKRLYLSVTNWVIASKFGFDVEGLEDFNGRPDHIKKVVEDLLKRLKMDHIDLYYLYYQHGVDLENVCRRSGWCNERSHSRKERFKMHLKRGGFNMRKIKTFAIVSMLFAFLLAGCNAGPTGGSEESSGEKEESGDDKVKGNMETITFKNGEWDMAGNVFYPENFDETQEYPAIVFTHPGGGVKEQTAGLYAKRMAEKGFVTLAFDASHQGASEGEPRYLENPAERVGDISAAVDYLTTLKYVDKERIGAAGICAGGGYTIAASTLDHRIKAVAGISTYDFGAAVRDGFPNEGTGNPEDQLAALKSASDARTTMANGGEPVYNTYVPNSEDELTEDSPTTAREAYEYYRTDRAFHPNSPNKMLATSALYLMNFDPYANIDKLLTQPLMLITGDISESRYYSERAYEKAATSDKELVIVEGATHVDMYDVPQYVNQAVDKMTTFFSEKM